MAVRLVVGRRVDRPGPTIACGGRGSADIDADRSRNTAPDVKSDADRRSVLQTAGLFGLLALWPGGARSLALSSPARGEAGRFLTAKELDTLRAVTARLIPGPPDDPDPGALEAGVAEAIDMLLAAFMSPSPPIHAGGPFSDRAGGSRDDFADFVPMDRLAELGWRIRIEGSKGLAEREFAGPVVGLQEVYRSGLARLDAAARKRFGVDFASLPGPSQDLLLSDPTDTELQPFISAAFANSLEAMYGPPEYGGNRDLVGWRYTKWAGDSQPRGHSDEEVSGPGGESLCLAGPAEKALVEGMLTALAGPAAPSQSLWSACPASVKP